MTLINQSDVKTQKKIHHSRLEAGIEKRDLKIIQTCSSCWEKNGATSWQMFHLWWFSCMSVLCYKQLTNHRRYACYPCTGTSWGLFKTSEFLQHYTVLFNSFLYSMSLIIYRFHFKHLFSTFFLCNFFVMKVLVTGTFKCILKSFFAYDLYPTLSESVFSD